MQEEEKKIALYENFKTINSIDPAYYEQYDVKRGLRNADGTGVVAGLTNIANVHGYVVSDNEKIADEGHLRYRGYDVYDLLGDQSAEHRFNFEEVSYLLLMGELPTRGRGRPARAAGRVHRVHDPARHAARHHECAGAHHPAAVRLRPRRGGPFGAP